MRPAVFLLLLLECGCVTKALWRRHPDEGRSFLTGVVEGPSAARATPPASPPRFAFSVPEGIAPPPRLARDLDAGRRWIRFLRPVGFAFAGQALLDGATPLRPDRARVEFVRNAGGDGPCVLCIEGPIPVDALRALVVEGGAPGPDADLDAIADDRLRRLVGWGSEAAVRLAHGDPPLATYEWEGVEGPDGAWEARVAEAFRAESLAPLEGYVAVIRRTDRAGETRRFRAPLWLVVLGAHLAETGEGRFVFEAFWEVELGGAPEPGAAPRWAEGLALSVRVEEYDRRPGRGLAGKLWRALLTPFALAADAWLGGRYYDEHGVESWDGRFEPGKSRERRRGR